jgi:hypothetical protein
MRQDDRRRSFRYGVDPTRRDARLFCGHRSVAVQIVNESAGGFGVACDVRPHVRPGEEARLECATGTFAVRVTYVLERARTEEHGKPATVAYRLGLERTADLGAAAADQATRRAIQGTAGQSAPMHPVKSLALTAIVAFLASLAVGSAVHLHGARAVVVEGTAGGPAAPPAPSRPQMLSLVSDRLGLSKAQREQFEHVAHGASAAVRELDVCWQSEAPEHRRRKENLVLEAVKEDVIRMVGNE